MGSNKFTLKIKFSSGVFPAKPGSSSFALTPLCCSRVAKNCKSSLLLHGFFGFVVFRLREWAPGQKMVSATASQAGPWPHMHQSMFLLLGLPRIWVLPALPCPVPRSPGRAVLQSWLPLTALLLHLPGARGGCCAPIPKHFLSVIPAVRVPWSCWPVRPATWMCSASQTRLCLRILRSCCVASLRNGPAAPFPTTQLPGFCPLAGSLLLLYLFTRLVDDLFPSLLEPGTAFLYCTNLLHLPCGSVLSLIPSPWGSAPLLLFSLEASACASLLCMLCFLGVKMRTNCWVCFLGFFGCYLVIVLGFQNPGKSYYPSS